jgi:AcrR family transcriptional regulator
VGLRERKKQLQRHSIAQAALELFRERGYDQTRVRDIAERVGISEATFFNYFPAKENVLDELALAQVELFEQTIVYQRSSATHAVPRRILELMQAAAAAIEADRDFQRTLYTRSNLFHSSGVLKRRTHEMYRELSALFELGRRRGEIRGDADPVQLAELLIAIYHFTTVNWLTDWWGEPEPLQARLDSAVELFLDGCRSR